MDDKKTKYRKEYFLENKENLIEYGKKYYNERIYSKVEIEGIIYNTTSRMKIGMIT
jgi:hypothetical protein